jgi:hypothetical protein
LINKASVNDLIKTFVVDIYRLIRGTHNINKLPLSRENKKSGLNITIENTKEPSNSWFTSFMPSWPYNNLTKDVLLNSQISLTKSVLFHWVDSN